MSNFTGTYFNGIVLSDPSTQNPTTVTSTGYIGNTGVSHSGDVVYGTNAAAWTLSNQGTIKATRPSGVGVHLAAGGSVINGYAGVNAALISGRNGIKIDGGAGTVTNFGTIATTFITAGSFVYYGGDAIDVRAGSGTLLNLGTITGYGYGVDFAGGGTVTNSGVIGSTALAAVYIHGGSGIVINSGTIAATPRPGRYFIYLDGVFLGAGGTVANTGLLRGNDGVRVRGNSIVTNIGTISGIHGGIKASAAGSVTVINSGTVSTRQGNAIDIFGGASTVMNAGAISASYGGFGISLSHGGNIGNSGVLSGGIGPNSFLDLYFGFYSPPGAGGAAIRLSGGGNIDNSGTVTGGHGGNGFSGRAPGGTGGAGIVLSDGGGVSNRGAIAGGPGGTSASAGAVGTGVILSAGGVLVNGSAGSNTALIAGSTGIQALGTSGATVTNYGTIASASGTVGTAVSFAGATGKLILEAGSRLVGEAVGGGGTLELAAAGGVGTVTGLGSQYLGFSSLAFDVGAMWTAEGSASGMPSTIIGFDPGDVIDVDGFAAVGDSYTGSGLVLVDTLGNSVTIGIQSSFLTTRDFQITADGHGGTNVTTLPAVLALSPASDSGIKGDNVTNVTTPVITGTGRPGNTLTLVDGVSVVGSTTIDGAGNWSVATSVLAAGSHSVTARQTDPAGDVSSPSLPLALTIDTSTAAPAELTLDPASDSGTKGDNSTDVTTPVIAGTGEIGAALTLLDGATAVGTTMVDATGNWSVTTSVLAVGKHTLTATEVDAAGNTSPASGPLTLTIEASGSPPTPPVTVPGAAAQLAFFAAGGGADKTNLVLTTDGTGLPPPVSGKFNIEVFTSTAGALAAGYDASAFLPGASSVGGNVVQTGTLGLPEQLLAGSYIVLDQTGAAAIEIDGNAAAATMPSSISVIGSARDTITGSTVAANSQLIDASALNPLAVPGAMTVAGGAGGTTVWGGKGDSITGGTGALQVNDALFAGSETVGGGAGALSVFSLGKNFSITGSTAGTTFTDDNYGKGGNSTITGGSGTATGAGGLAVNTVIIGAAGDTIIGGSGTTYLNAINGSQAITVGSGATTVQAAAGDTIAGGSGTLQVYLDNDQATTTINLGAGHGAASLRDVAAAGGRGGAVTVTGFSTAGDVIQSAGSVAAAKFLGTSKSDGSGGTILTFVDGATMTLAGIADASKIAFAS